MATKSGGKKIMYLFLLISYHGSLDDIFVTGKKLPTLDVCECHRAVRRCVTSYSEAS